MTRTVGAHLDAEYFHPKRTARSHLRMLATEARVPVSRVDEVLEVFGLTSVAGKRPKGSRWAWVNASALLVQCRRSRGL
ncbi:MAG: hypothetical protein WCF36_00755 [Candidatus Nanopelagicales bacterium]